MINELIKKIAIVLTCKQFKLLTAIMDKDENEIAAVFFKAESPVVYYVSVLDFDKLLTEEYKRIITAALSDMLEKNKSMFNMGVCVNLLIADNVEHLKAFADKQDNIYDGNIHNIWWYADVENKSIQAGKGQPNKINGIEDLLSSALYNLDVDIDKPIEKINEEGAKKSQLKQIEKYPLFVIFLVIINLVIFCFEMYGGNKNLYVQQFGINNSLIFSEKQFYRLITYMFLHGSIEHILMNSLALYIYGSKAERYCGRLKTAIVYFVSGIAGGLLSSCFNTGFAVGASGAIFGLLGALLAICKKTGKQIDGLSYMTMAVLAVVSIGMGFLEPQIDNFGHIGGLIGGFAAGIFLYKYKEE